MQATVLSRTLDLVSSMCDSRGTCMPRTLILGVDNTCRESKNQYFMTFLAWLKSTQKFDTIEVQYLQSGHSHNEQDPFAEVEEGGGEG